MQQFSILRRYFYILTMPLFLSSCAATSIDCSRPVFNGVTTAPPLGCGSDKLFSLPSSSASTSLPSIPEENLSAKQLIEHGESLEREGQAKIEEGRRLIEKGKRMLHEHKESNN